LGSFFAGVKAGTLSGILYLGGLAAFNVVLLYALRPEVLSAIQQSYASICGPAAVNGTSIEDCFSLVVSVYVPFDAFVGFFVALIYAGIFGIAYDSLPTRNPGLKGVSIAAFAGLSLIVFNLSGFYFSTESAIATTAFLLVWTVVFGYFLGRLYKKYTRLVKFDSQDPELLKVVVDGKESTGKSRTFALTSSHRIRAEVADDASFKEWNPIGGITLEDPKSFETLMEVNGDGSVKGSVGRKY